MTAKVKSIPERRKYLRLDTVLPVQFRFLDPDSEGFLSQEIQGFTNNIGNGGICLAVNNLNPPLDELIKEARAGLSLNIEIPLTGKTIPAQANINWVQEISKENHRYLIGLSYKNINLRDNLIIMRYAWTKKLFAPVILSAVLILGAGFLINSIINTKLIEGNKALVGQLVKIVQESSIAKQKVKEIAREKGGLQLRIQALESRIETVMGEKDNLAQESEQKEAKTLKKMEELSSLVEGLNKEKVVLQEQLNSLHLSEGVVAEELLRLDKKKSTLEKANIDKMYQWLRVHQNPRTGLVMSFEGDDNMQDCAFIYDQALAIQAYTYFSDSERARKILDFFDKKAERKFGLFFNSYYSGDGKAAEYIMHSGPNIWLGISALQYGQKTKDMQYLRLAEEIAAEAVKLQDEEGGLRGGPMEEWYATEHNLDAWAFFNMLYKVTTKEKYLQARNRTLNWLMRHTYDKNDIPIKRGKGDSTIATDTYAWSVASLGPEKLEELGMSPDRILEFAEQNCSVEVSYIRPEGEAVKVKGFDFAAKRNIARAGVVSSEWTAQMVLSFKIMADYYNNRGLKAKAHAYEMKADEYMAQLSNLIISSPSPSGQGESCLPYATQDFVDTGHGWMTPRGKSTGSLAGTAYVIFAYYNYNPLELKE